MASWGWDSRTDAYWLKDTHARDRELARRWGLYDQTPPVRPEPHVERFHQTGAEWVAWRRGDRWCRRCKADVPPTEESCPMCGQRSYGKVA